MSNWALTVLAILVATVLLGVAILTGAVSAIGQILLFVVLVAAVMGLMHNFRKRI